MTPEACACAILLRDGAVLLGRRAPHKRAYPNCWDILGGHIEAGETPPEALIREVEEEAGVTPTAFEAIGFFTEPNPEINGPVGYYVFVVTAWSGGEPAMLGDEHTEFRWFPLADASRLPDLAVPQYKRLFQDLARHAS
ncbi:MAG: NUDIX domain-containing protein [Proteobacteria bacterium]|nr:NUDIX domain-containing protein [Pseudomonadota bacterium]MBI3499355.1 NUDIX domain-containing protein [Pseudomonadota bacterium]